MRQPWCASSATLFHAHVTRALAAAIFGALAGLSRDTEARVPQLMGTCDGRIRGLTCGNVGDSGEDACAYAL